MNVALSEKDRKFREFALEGSMWKVIWKVCYPLAIYQSLNQLFKILDTMMAAHISANAVSTVAYLSQINMAISALGGGLAVGASIKISEAYGEGNFELVKRRVSTLFALCGLLGMAIIAILIPVAPQFLRLANTPEEFIEEGTVYFILELVSRVIIFFNNVYIAIERARGNSKRILNLNMMVIGIKLSLTAFFVYVLKGGINYISIATIVSQLALLGVAVFYMNAKENVFGFSWKAISFRKLVVAPMIKLSVPVIVEKMAFSLGKVVVNSMSTVYGTLTVGALGISNNIGGITTNPQNGFQEGASAIISQNLGAGKKKRALKAFWCVLVMNLTLSVVLMSASLLCLHQIADLFANGDHEFAGRIMEIYRMEALGTIPLGASAAVMAFLYGYGKTKLTLLLNFSRVFVFRIPVLWGLQHFTDLGNVSAGIVMAVSNIMTAVMSLVIFAIEFCQIQKEERTDAEQS